MPAHNPLRILVFCKEPHPGEVKTRLATAIGLQAAADVAAMMLRDTLTLTRAIASARADARLEVIHQAIAPAAFEAWLASAAPIAELTPQVDGTLGERLAAGLQGGGTRLALGMDTPDLPPERLQQAAGLLERDDVEVVLGPAPDGGYYLLGLADGVDPAFLAGEIRWSTAHTQVDTLAAAARSGLRTALLPPHSDVDELADLRALAERLAADPTAAPATAAWLARRLDLMAGAEPRREEKRPGA